MRKPKPYWNPYIAGVGLGLTLLASFVIMGRGLGASGALSSVVSVMADAVSPEHANVNPMYSAYLDNSGRNPLNTWLVFEVIGVIIGGFLSGILAGRFKRKVDKGPNTTNILRVISAFLGGTLMGFGAKLARGCTSGQALTGSALLNTGSWLFMLSLFAGGYLFAWFVRRLWK
jgi:uncharacterized protein